MNRFLPLAVILLITSCVSNETSDSKNIKQSEIYQNYNINIANGEVSATASFRFGGENGTTLKLSNPSKITFNGQKLTERKFLFGGAYYGVEQNSYSSKNVFRFTDTDGKVYENSFDFEPIEIKKAPKSVSKQADLVMQLSRKIEKGEILMLSAQSDTSQAKEMFIRMSPEDTVYYIDSTQELVIKPGFFKGFADVPAKIWIEKYEARKPLEQPTNLEGELHFSFLSKEIKVLRVDKK